MARKDGSTGIFINMHADVSERLGILAKKERRKKGEQALYLIEQGIKDIKSPGKKATPKK